MYVNKFTILFIFILLNSLSLSQDRKDFNVLQQYIYEDSFIHLVLKTNKIEYYLNEKAYISIQVKNISNNSIYLFPEHKIESNDTKTKYFKEFAKDIGGSLEFEAELTELKPDCIVDYKDTIIISNITETYLSAYLSYAYIPCLIWVDQYLKTNNDTNLKYYLYNDKLSINSWLAELFARKIACGLLWMKILN